MLLTATQEGHLFRTPIQQAMVPITCRRSLLLLAVVVVVLLLLLRKPEAAVGLVARLSAAEQREQQQNMPSQRVRRCYSINASVRAPHLRRSARRRLAAVRPNVLLKNKQFRALYWISNVCRRRPIFLSLSTTISKLLPFKRD